MYETRKVLRSLSDRGRLETGVPHSLVWLDLGITVVQSCVRESLSVGIVTILVYGSLPQQRRDGTKSKRICHALQFTIH